MRHLDVLADMIKKIAHITSMILRQVNNFGLMWFEINWGSVFLPLLMWKKFEYKIILPVTTHRQSPSTWKKFTPKKVNLSARHDTKFYTTSPTGSQGNSRIAHRSPDCY